MLWNDLIIGINDVNLKKTVKMIDLRNIMNEYRKYAQDLKIDPIKGALLLSRPYDIIIKIQGAQNSYTFLYNPHPDNIVAFGSLSPYSYVPDTFINTQYAQEYLIYMTHNLETQLIGGIIFISKDDLKFIANIYNKKEMNRKASSNFTQSEKKHIHYDLYLKKIYTPNIRKKYYENPVPNHIDALNKLYYTIEIFKRDLDYINDSKIWYILRSMGFGYNDYIEILRSK